MSSNVEGRLAGAEKASELGHNPVRMGELTPDVSPELILQGEGWVDGGW